jgi:hypothetical protein
MKRAFIVVLLMLGLSSLAFAGKIYGSITEAGKPVAAGVKVEVSCGGKSYAAQTDAYGSFKLFVPDKGKGTLKVYYQGQTPSFEINSYASAAQYDLILEKTGGQYTLKRR